MTWKILLVVGLLVCLGYCRVYETSLKFSELKEHSGWYYLQKFKFAEGVAKFHTQFYVRGKGKSKSHHQLYVQGIPSEKWEQEQELKCKSSITMPVIIQPLRMTGQKVSNMFQFSVNKDDTYYFVIKDCMQMYRKDYDNDNLILHIKFDAFSNNIPLNDAPDQISPDDPEEEIVVEEEPSTQETQAEIVEIGNKVPDLEEAPPIPRLEANVEESPAEALDQPTNTEQL